MRQEMSIGQFIHQALLRLHFYLTLPGTQRGDVIALTAQKRSWQLDIGVTCPGPYNSFAEVPCWAWEFTRSFCRFMFKDLFALVS